MSESSGPYAHLVGKEFPGGTYRIERWRSWLVADAVGDDPWDDDPHPVLVWMAGVGGMGLRWDDLFAWFDATADEGPMFGEHRTLMHTRIRNDVTYDVSGRVVSVQRKVGRRAGPFDIVAYELDLHAGDEHVATCRNSIVFPRRDT